MSRGIGVLFFMLLSLMTRAQNPGFWHLSDKEGLSTSTIYNIFEDKLGFIYLGTPNGLMKFDGFKFEVISNINAKTADASDIQQDSKGNIWFSNFNHELFVHKPGEPAKKIEALSVLNFNQLGKFVIDHKDNLWFYDDKRLQLYETSKNKITTINTVSSFHGAFQKITNIGFFNATLSGVRIFRFNTYPNLTIEEFPANNQNQRLAVPDIFFNLEQNFISECNVKLEKYPPNFKIIHLSDFPWIRAVNNYGILPNKTIWVCTSSGVVFFDSEGKILNNGKIFFEGRNTSYFIQDKKENYWVGTLDDGLFMVTDFSIQNHIFYNDNHITNRVSCLYEENNKLFIGTQNGEIKIYENGTFKTWKTNLGRSVFFIRNTGGDNNYLINAFLTKELAPAGKIINNIGAPKGWVQDNNKITFANNIGVFSIELKDLISQNVNKKLPPITYRKVSQDGMLISDSTLDIYGGKILQGRSGKLFKDKIGRIWISSTAGLYYKQGDILTKTILSHNLNAMALDFAEDNEGTIYIFISNEGIYKWRNGKLKKYFSIENGLLSNTAKRMFWIKDKLWVATPNGLNLINTKINKLYTFRINDGLLSNDIIDIAYCDNKIWLASNEGVSVIPADYLPKNSNPPLLFFTAFKVNGKELNYSPGISKISLNYDQNNIEFDFKGLNYRSRDLLYYMYRLSGQGDDWIKLNGINHSVIFQGLSPGNYIFEVKAFNDKGISSENTIIVKFSINKPWWNQWWFYLVVALLIGITTYIIIKNRNEERRKKEKLESELRISQLTSLKAQMNPHFMFNALNSIQDFILLNDKVSANTYLGKFSDLMRMVLDMSNKPDISLSNELKALNLYLQLESIRFEDTLKYKITTSENLDPTEWQLPSMIIQPFVENAIKHGLLHKRQNRELSIMFNRKPDTNILQVCIEDNGVGRKEAERIKKNRMKQHESFATGATDQRLKLLNMDDRKQIQINYTDLEDEAGNATGTKVEIEITLKPIS